MQLTRLVVGLGLAIGFMASAAAQTTMRISISTAQNSHQGVAIDTFAKEVEKRTGGRYKVQTFYNGALGGERESIEAVQLGTQELAFSSTGPVPNFRARDQNPRRALPVPRQGPCARGARRHSKRDVNVP
jgi:TRAP-type C4-dicarboxylate transport system substrate-binding protein